MTLIVPDRITGSLMFLKTKLNVACVAGVPKGREREF